MARRRESTLEALFDLASLLPWWLALILAAVSYVGFHQLSLISVPKPTDVAGLSPAANWSMAKAVGLILQYLLPIIFTFGAFGSAVRRWRGKAALKQIQGRADQSAFLEMSWRDFERAVAEGFRQRGYSVSENDGPGADGGIDLMLRKGREKFLVQCKKWKATMVGVDVVRELFGVMAAQGAVGGFVVTSGTFSPDARQFAEGRNIELMDGKALLSFVSAASSSQPNRTPPSTTEPSCPECGSAMVKRTAKRGSKAGGEFWGCSTYPKCRGIRPVT